MPPDCRLATFKNRMMELYSKSMKLKNRTMGLWSIRIEEKSLVVGFRRRKISCHNRLRTPRSETMIPGSRLRTFKRGKVAEIWIRQCLMSRKLNSRNNWTRHERI